LNKTIILLFIIASSIFASENYYYEEIPDKDKELLTPKIKKSKHLRANVGFAHGPETFAPAVIPPNISIDFFLNNNSYIKVYYGLNFSLWVLVVVGGHVGGHIGLDLKYIFIEAGISKLFWIDNMGSSVKELAYLTFNPKIGIKILDLIYLKTGPVFYPFGVSQFAKEHFAGLGYLEINDRYWNVEIGCTWNF